MHHDDPYHFVLDRVRTMELPQLREVFEWALVGLNEIPPAEGDDVRPLYRRTLEEIDRRLAEPHRTTP